MSDTKLSFYGGYAPALARCGCKLIGSTAVVLCPLHAGAQGFLDACKEMASCQGNPQFVGSVFFDCAREKARAAIAAYEKAVAQEGEPEPIPETATPGDSEVDDIVAQVIDQIGRDQIVEAMLSGKGGERFGKIAEALTKRVDQGHKRLSSIVEYITETSHSPDELYRLLDEQIAVDEDGPVPDREPPTEGNCEGKQEPPVVQAGDSATVTLVCHDCARSYYAGPHYQNRQRCGRCLEKVHKLINVYRAPGGEVDLRG